MKKIIILAVAAAMAFIAVAGLTGCGKEKDEPVAGGYTEDRAITDEDMEIFEKALDGLTGVSYEPTLVATQVVAGINYRFTATATMIIPDAEPYEVYIYIFKPLEGDPELTEIVNIGEEQ